MLFSPVLLLVGIQDTVHKLVVFAAAMIVFIHLFTCV
jgi:hypothetical protein